MNHYYYSKVNRNLPVVVAFSRGDVTGDGVLDHVYLTGIKTSHSPFVENITLHVQEGRTGMMKSVPLHKDGNAGYDPSLFLGDFTGDGVADILIRINSGGSGAITYDYMYSFIGQTPQLLFDFNKYNQEYQYEVTYLEDYKVQIISKKNNQVYLIDLSKSRSTSYLNEIYDENGELKSPISGFVNPLSGLYPVDFDGDGVFELLAYQKIAGQYNADSLGYVLNTLGWRDGHFELVLLGQYVAIFGSEL